MRELNRRQFLQTSAAATAAASLTPAFPALAQAAHPHVEAWPENGTLIPDEGWRLWVDAKAEWKQDAIFLPEDVTRDAAGVVMGKGKPLPVNAPTGGWGVLGASGKATTEGIGVTLPSTVEQHYWGKFGAGEGGKPRPYTPEEYRYAVDDPIPQNGAYFGVSWWYRHIDIPAALAAKRIFLHVGGRICGPRCI
jgi:beta-galactosidase